MSRQKHARPTSTQHRRFAAAVLVVVAVAGLGAASAAQLDVSAGPLNAGTAVVASCQPVGQPITVSFTSAFSAGAYRATEVRLSNVNAACSGLAYQIQLTNGVGGAVGTELSGTVSLTADVLTVGIPSTPVTSIGGVAAVIHS